MFTGIVQATAKVANIKEKEGLKELLVPLPHKLMVGLEPGASVSVQGVCLTVTKIEANTVLFDVGQETLKCTTLDTLHVDSMVNVERSLTYGSEVGGHLLSGHIFGIATIDNISDLGDEQRVLTIKCDHNLIRYIFPKGYIALNGVSLTVNETDIEGFFTVNLIPETLKRTTFTDAYVGETVNVEIDNTTLAIVETVERILAEKRLPST